MLSSCLRVDWEGERHSSRQGKSTPWCSWPGLCRHRPSPENYVCRPACAVLQGAVLHTCRCWMAGPCESAVDAQTQSLQLRWWGKVMMTDQKVQPWWIFLEGSTVTMSIVVQLCSLSWAQRLLCQTWSKAPFISIPIPMHTSSPCPGCCSTSDR